MGTPGEDLQLKPQDCVQNRKTPDAKAHQEHFRQESRDPSGYLSRLSNGLTYAADRMGKEDFTAVVPLTKCERSVMASRAAELL